MADHDKHDHNHEPGRSTVATFASRAEAREAISALHKRHYSHTWLGVTSLADAGGGEASVTVESQVGGFFSGTQSLVDALVSRGVLGDAARDIERTIEPGNALVTVDPKDKDLGEAVALLEEYGGRVAGRSLQAGSITRSTRASLITERNVEADGDGDGDEETFYHRAALRR